MRALAATPSVPSSGRIDDAPEPDRGWSGGRLTRRARLDRRFAARVRQDSDLLAVSSGPGARGVA